MRWGVSGMALGAIALLLACGEPETAPSPAVPPATASIPPSPVPLVVPLAGDLSPFAQGPEIVFQSRLLEQDLAGWWTVRGRLLNAGDAAARNVRVTARFYDEAGLLFSTRDAIVSSPYIEPGQEAYYALTWPPDPPLIRVTLTPSWD